MSRLATPELARKHLGNLTALATGRFPVCLTRATTTRIKCALNYETANFCVPVFTSVLYDTKRKKGPLQRKARATTWRRCWVPCQPVIKSIFVCHAQYITAHGDKCKYTRERVLFFYCPAESASFGGLGVFAADHDA